MPPAFNKFRQHRPFGAGPPFRRFAPTLRPLLKALSAIWSTEELINTIRNLVKLEFALIALIVIALFFTESYLPVELQEYLAMDYETTPTTMELVALIALLVVALVNLASMFGLLGVRLWARKAYIYSSIIIFPLCLFFGPQVDHAIAYTLDQVSVLVQGMILSLLIYNSSYQEAALNKSSNSDGVNAAGS